MRKRLLVSASLLGMVVALMFAPACGKKAVSHIAFTTPAQTIIAGGVSRVMTIQTRDTNGNPVNVGSATSISLTSTSSTGKFDTSATGAFDGTITWLTIPSGSNSVSFYYKDTAVGIVIIAAASPWGWTPATQIEVEIEAGYL